MTFEMSAAVGNPCPHVIREQQRKLIFREQVSHHDFKQVPTKILLFQSSTQKHYNCQARKFVLVQIFTFV